MIVEYIFIRLPKINRIYLFIDEHLNLFKIDEGDENRNTEEVDRHQHTVNEKKNKCILLKNNTKNKQTTCR